MSDAIDIATVPAIPHRQWSVHLATELERDVQLFRQLGPDEWAAPTACELWTVRDMAGHMSGMVEGLGSPRTFARLSKAAAAAVKRDGGAFIDALTAIQVEEHASISTDALVDGIEALAPKTARAVRRIPAPMRWVVRMKQDPPFDHERFSLGYITEKLAVRDPWTHRMDIGRATGRQPVLTAEHDGRLVADAVVEWARRHGQPFTLTLTGPAGGAWRSGTGGEELELDAIEFCLTLSGRLPGQGLLTTPVPF